MAPRRSRPTVGSAAAAGDLAIDGEGVSPDELGRLLDARDRVLARRGLDRRQDAGDRRAILLARVGEARIGVPIEAVAAVLPPVRAAVAPGAPAHLIGLFAHDGAIHNLFAIEGALGLPPAAAPRTAAAALVLRRPGPRIAIAIDEAIDVVAAPPDGGSAGDGSPLRFVAGEGEEATVLVDVERLLAALGVRGAAEVEGETN